MAQSLSLSQARAAMASLHRAPEADVLAALAPRAAPTPEERTSIVNRARGLLADLRAARDAGWVNRFLQEYRLNSEEGVALLSLAEAFLRVPDPETADLLIRDKLGGADWRAHAGHSESVLVNSATFGLVLARAVLGGSAQAGALKRLVARAGEPFVRTAVGAAMRAMGQVFVMGRTIEEAMKRAGAPDHAGFTASFDMLGEAARTEADAARYFAAYETAVETLGGARGAGHSISVKLSALHPRYETAHAGACVPALAEKLAHLAAKAAQGGVGLTVDAEESERLMMSLDIIEKVARDGALKHWDGLGMAVQAYGKRARAVIAWADALGAETGRRILVRLVKGAYWDSEIKKAQIDGVADFPVFTRKPATDVSYLACARDMLERTHIAPAFASHNALTVAAILEWAGERRDFEFQRLHGMGEGLYERLVRAHGYACRTYAPVGGHRELLAYLVRRLLENGANSSFVHQVADRNVSEQALLRDPAERIAAIGGAPHPSIRAPRDLFPGRVNSAGLDLDDAGVLADLKREIDAWRARASWRGAPLIGGRAADGPSIAVRRPADGEPIGLVIEASGVDVAKAIDQAAAAAPAWAARPVEDRAACLERLADLLEEHRTELMALAVHEAGKTFADALAEVREAVDFCRYYAQTARVQFAPLALPGPTGESNELRLAGRGVFACIAPWNFPLAIFLGQTAAALVAGNAVIAKPAPQTPLIAQRAIELAHQAGAPAEALHLLPGGREVGAAIVADPRIAGVAFTGSIAAARAIAQALLADEGRPLVPLIAETGGLNAMIVDSTALPEQVVGDVITSAFRSAGQRCSALRLLLLQEDAAARMLEMLKGAMDALVLGDPADPRTDVGPVIDAGARDRLEAYRQSQKTRWLHALEAPAGNGFFTPPTLIGLDAIEDLKQEWFGPLLHVATWKGGELEETVARVNASGFGLTMGLHSRIAHNAALARASARAGNLYINRSMIGAVVGSQPFGGEGLSGTGPKAGGPHYLARFAVERTVSIDTTSSGGDSRLMSLDD